jgi:SAM-dependent methyltransferase
MFIMLNFKNYFKKIIHLKEWLIFKKIEAYTMVGHEKLYFVYDISSKIEQRGITGSVVECGVWKGGTAAVMASVIKKYKSQRSVWLFDSFEGLPKPSKDDGEDALKQYQNDRGLSKVTDVYEAFAKLSLPLNNVFIRKGWFEETLTPNSKEIGPIALLRLDSDWYQSTKICLETLYDQVVDGGYIVIDDYYAWPGCKKAVDEFIELNKLTVSIKSAGGKAVYFVKPPVKGNSYWSVESFKYKNPHRRIKTIYEELFNLHLNSVIDLGCGYGQLGSLLGPNFEYTGVDVFEQKYFPGNYQVFDLNKADYKTFPFLTKFDAVVVSGLMEYLDFDRVKLLLTFISNNLMTKNSFLIATYTNFSHYSQTEKTFHPKWVTIKKLKEMASLFESSGFRVVKKYPSYYFIFNLAINNHLHFWIPFVSEYFGRQIIFVLKK